MKILMTTTNEKENKLSEIDPRPREKRFTMRSHVKFWKFNFDSSLRGGFIHRDKYIGIICGNLKNQSFEKWDWLGKFAPASTTVENCKFWARMRAARLQCTPRKCSRMHAPTTLLFASLLPNAWRKWSQTRGLFALRFGKFQRSLALWRPTVR